MNMGLSEKKRRFDEDKAFPHIMLAPTIIAMLIMTVYPIAFTIYYSFTDYNLLKAAKKGYNWIGFDNFTKLFQNAVFRTAIFNTVKFTLFAVLAETLIGLLEKVNADWEIRYPFLPAGECPPEEGNNQSQ